MLLNGDGHIKLADMGGVAEFAEGTCLETNKASHTLGLFCTVETIVDTSFKSLAVGVSYSLGVIDSSRTWRKEHL